MPSSPCGRCGVVDFDGDAGLPACVPSPAPFAAPLVLLLLGGAALWRTGRDVMAWDPAVLGNDVASVMRERFRVVRSELAAAGVEHVALLQGERELDATQAAVLELVAAALHRRLCGGDAAPPPGFDAAHIDALAEGFRGRFPPEQNRDVAAVRTNLRAWWAGLAAGMGETDMQYGLAPFVVRAGSPWVVVVMPPGGDAAVFAAQRRLDLVRDCGNGVALCRERR